MDLIDLVHRKTGFVGEAVFLDWGCLSFLPSPLAGFSFAVGALAGTCLLARLGCLPSGI